MDFLTHNAGIIGLLFFFTTFSIIAFHAFRPSVKQKVEAHKYIPLQEDQ